jgi:hypothetical protein
MSLSKRGAVRSQHHIFSAGAFHFIILHHYTSLVEEVTFLVFHSRIAAIFFRLNSYHFQNTSVLQSRLF